MYIYTKTILDDVQVSDLHCESNSIMFSFRTLERIRRVVVSNAPRIRNPIYDYLKLMMNKRMYLERTSIEIFETVCFI